MADYTSYCLQNKSEMTALGNAIRSKAGVSGTLTVPQMTNAVKNIQQTTVVSTPKVVVPTISFFTTVVDEAIIPRMKITSTSSASGYTNASKIELYKVTDTGLTKTQTGNGSTLTVDLLPSSGTVKKSTHNKIATRALCSNGMGSAVSNFFINNTIGAVQVSNCTITGGQNKTQAGGIGIFTGLKSLEQDAYATFYVSFISSDNSDRFDNREVRLTRISYVDDCDQENQIFRGEIPNYCTIEISANLYNLSDEETGCDGNDRVNFNSVGRDVGYSILNYIKVIYYKCGSFSFYGNNHSFDQATRTFYFITEYDTFTIERGQYSDTSANLSQSFSPFS